MLYIYEQLIHNSFSYKMIPKTTKSKACKKGILQKAKRKNLQNKLNVEYNEIISRNRHLKTNIKTLDHLIESLQDKLPNKIPKQKNINGVQVISKIQLYFQKKIVIDKKTTLNHKISVFKNQNKLIRRQIIRHECTLRRLKVLENIQI